MVSRRKMDAYRNRVSRLRTSGVPVSTIAEIARTKPLEIYAWIAGAEKPPEDVLSRVDIFSDLLERSFHSDPKAFHRVWMLQQGEKPSLKDILCASEIDQRQLQRRARELGSKAKNNPSCT